MKYLVYGGNGWIGSMFIKLLKKHQLEYYTSKLRLDNTDAIETEIIPINNLKTPFKKGDVVAMLKVTIPKAAPQYIDLVAAKNIDEAGYISSFIAYIYNSAVSFFD